MYSTSPKSHARPPKSPSRSPQKRRPLHERTSSRTNEIVTPTIRIISDPDTQIYSKPPLSSHRSQVPPYRKSRASAFKISYDPVPDENTINSTSTFLAANQLPPAGAKRTSTSSTDSDPQVFTTGSRVPLSNRSSQGTALSLSSPRTNDNPRGLSVVQEEPAPRERLTIRPVVPSNTGIAASVTNRLSQISLASSASSDTLAARKHEDRRASANSRLFSSPPRHLKRLSVTGPGSRESMQATNARIPPNSSSKQLAGSPTHPSSRFGSNERPRSASSPETPLRATLEAANANGITIQYPMFRPAPVFPANSWVETSATTSQNLSRTYDSYQRQQPWISRLSTIPSEPDPLVQAMSQSSNRNTRPRRRTTGSVAGGVPLIWSGSSSPVPKTFMSRVRPHPEKDLDEQSDTLGDLQRLPLRKQRSGYSAKLSADSRPSSQQSDAQSDRESQSSVISSLPAWTKYVNHVNDWYGLYIVTLLIQTQIVLPSYGVCPSWTPGSLNRRY